MTASVSRVQRALIRLGSVALLFSGAVAPNVLGMVMVVAQAIATGVFAELQFIGLRKSGGTVTGSVTVNGDHTIGGSLYAPLVIRGLGTRQVYSASTLDQMPKHVALGLMYGSPVAFTVPDLDRTDYLVIIGGNPLVSNGSLATAADFPGKIKALRRRVL